MPGQAPLPDLSGRAVFVGYQELGIPQASDSFPTAFPSPDGVDQSGVEIAATAFANLLHGEGLRALPEWGRILLVALLGAGFTLASCLGMVCRGLAATLSLAAAYAGITAACFALGNLWLPVVVPLLGLLPMAVGLGQVVRYLGAARWLNVYAPRQVSQHLLKGHEFATARLQRREVTVMMTDIAGFTTLAEHTTPEALTEFVNRHFTLLARCVEAEGGTVAQFIGDSMMAFWGAPVPQPDHAARACRTALAIAKALADEQERHAVPGGPQVRLRIGINTGEVTAGNVGAPGRCHYGIVGDTVNTTQRIEQLAKQVCPDGPPVAILVSAVTRAQAGSTFGFVDAGLHTVRGRESAVRIHRLMQQHHDREPSLQPMPLPETGDRPATALPPLAPAHG
jgi:class 3 adenylate cyclase